MTSVNCKVKFIRPQYANLREWMADPQNVYVGRRGVVFIGRLRFPPQDSDFANPFTVKEHGRERALELYRGWLAARMDNEAGFVDRLKALKGKNLGCWCKPDACHADILLEVIGRLE